VIAHETDTVRNWMRMIKEKGLKAALEARDGPFNRK
jgi:hypothetical protein